MIKINGMILDAAELPLARYLEENGYVRSRIAVEINEVIIPKAQYDGRILRDGDTVEIVSLVGGG